MLAGSVVAAMAALSSASGLRASFGSDGDSSSDCDRSYRRRASKATASEEICEASSAPEGSVDSGLTANTVVSWLPVATEPPASPMHFG